MWTSVKTARQRGYNVRKEADGWQIAELTIKGWQWKPFLFPTKAKALAHVFIVHTNKRAVA